MQNNILIIGLRRWLLSRSFKKNSINGRGTGFHIV